MKFSVSRAPALFAIAALLVSALLSVLPIPQASAAACTPTLSILPTASQVANGTNALYTLALANTGTGTCSGVYFSLYYPSELTFVSANPSASSGGYYWNFTSLTAGQTRTISLVAKAQTAQSLPRSVSLDGCLNAGGIDACNSASITIAASVPSPTPSLCGNGAINVGEMCDDGNLNPKAYRKA